MNFQVYDLWENYPKQGSAHFGLMSIRLYLCESLFNTGKDCELHLDTKMELEVVGKERYKALNFRIVPCSFYARGERRCQIFSQQRNFVLSLWKIICILNITKCIYKASTALWLSKEICWFGIFTEGYFPHLNGRIWKTCWIFFFMVHICV